MFNFFKASNWGSDDRMIWKLDENSINTIQEVTLCPEKSFDVRTRRQTFEYFNQGYYISG